jgi:hypothetical protein
MFDDMEKALGNINLKCDKTIDDYKVSLSMFFFFFAMLPQLA